MHRDSDSDQSSAPLSWSTLQVLSMEQFDISTQSCADLIHSELWWLTCVPFMVAALYLLPFTAAEPCQRATCRVDWPSTPPALQCACPLFQLTLV